MASVRINQHLKKFSLLDINQFGFQSKNSTESAVLCLLNYVYDAIDADSICLAIFLDYSKAFDTISHGILCLKLLQQFKFSKKACEWIFSYLTDRQQYVKFDTEVSGYKNIKYGVPQGSILGPLLFKMYINDFNTCLTNGYTKTILYADDTIILLQSKDLSDLINKGNIELINVSQYCKLNRLILNADKSKAMLFNLKKQIPIANLTINNNIIDYVSVFKYLGFTIDNHLNFKSMVDHTVSKLASCNGVLSRASRFIPRDSLTLLYRSIGISHVLYIKSILVTLSSFKLAPIQTKMLHSGAIINNCLLKYVSGDIYSLQFLLLFYYYLFIYKVVNKQFSPQLNNLLKAPNHGYNTRHGHTMFLPLMSKTITQRNFSYNAPKFWNKLPLYIKDKSIYSFRNDLQEFLQNC